MLGNSEPDANPLRVSEGENDAAARRLTEDSMSELFSVSLSVIFWTRGEVVVYESDGLAEGVDDGGTDKFHTSFFEVF